MWLNYGLIYNVSTLSLFVLYWCQNYCAPHSYLNTHHSMHSCKTKRKVNKAETKTKAKAPLCFSSLSLSLSSFVSSFHQTLTAVMSTINSVLFFLICFLLLINVSFLFHTFLIASSKQINYPWLANFSIVKHRVIFFFFN